MERAVLRRVVRVGLPVLVAALVAVAAAYRYSSLRAFVLGVEVTAPQRGYQVAARSGCFACHGVNGGGGVKNPGSEDGEVPGFAGGTPMMWAKSEAELREYVLDGAPARKRGDPRYRERMEAQLLAMPAYRGHLSEAEVDDLIAYVRAVSGLVVPSDPVAARGNELAYRFACFNCHGPMGAGGVENPGSFKGYVPGWWGKDYRDLVRNDDELRGWIVDGQIPRLGDNFVARHFLGSQRVSMPAYRDFLKEDELQALMAYVRWVHDGDWRDKALDLAH